MIRTVLGGNLPSAARTVSLTALATGIFLTAASPALARRIEKHFAVDGHTVVTLHNPTGTITIRAWSKPEVLVIADHASDKVDVDAEQTGNRVDLITRAVADGVSPAEFETNYQVNVPEDTELQIHDDSGVVDVSQVLGDMAVETVGAGVNLADAAGYLTIRTVDGAVQCTRCAGRIEINSISGSIKLLQVRSYNIRAQTSNGNILLDGEFLPNGVYRLKNYSGLIEVRYSPEDSFDLSATSLKGSVTNDATLKPHSHTPAWTSKFGNSLLGTFNAGRAKVELSSFDGTINIHKR
jgi:DUF4097 and DUF4098 domain-containing protein YvlB